MMELKELFMDIRKELRCADKYAKESVKHKTEFPELSEAYHRVATDKIAHAEMLNHHAKLMAEKHHMMEVWEIEDYMVRHDVDEIKREMANIR